MHTNEIAFLLPWIFLLAMAGVFIHAPKFQRNAGKPPGAFFNLYEFLTLVLGLGIISMGLYPSLPNLLLNIMYIWGFFWIFVSVILSFFVRSRWFVFIAAFPAIMTLTAVCSILLNPTLPPDMISRTTFLHYANIVAGAAISWMSIAALTLSRRKSRTRLVSSSTLKLKADHYEV